MRAHYISFITSLMGFDGLIVWLFGVSFAWYAMIRSFLRFVPAGLLTLAAIENSSWCCGNSPVCDGQQWLVIHAHKIVHGMPALHTDFAEFQKHIFIPILRFE